MGLVTAGDLAAVASTVRSICRSSLSETSLFTCTLDPSREVARSAGAPLGWIADIDLTIHDGTRLAKDPGERRKQVRALLHEAVSIQLKDYFEFLIGEACENLDGAPEGDSVAGPPSGRNSARRSYHAVWSVRVKWALAGLGFGTT